MNNFYVLPLSWQMELFILEQGNEEQEKANPRKLEGMGTLEDDGITIENCDVSTGATGSCLFPVWNS